MPLPRAPRHLCLAPAQARFSKPSASESRWEAPLKNSFVQWETQPCFPLAASLGPRVQGHMVGSEMKLGPDIPVWWPWRPLVASTHSLVSASPPCS